MIADPTMALVESLADESKWVVVRNVPVCKPHRRDGKRNGKPVTVDITEADLPRIADRVNALYADHGVPARVTVGHVRQEPGFPEERQPKLRGFAVNAKVGRYGPKQQPGVLCDLYVMPEHRSVLRDYPFRSMEFDPDTDEIRGVGLLIRDPWLDMGAIHYQGDRFLVRYEGGMNDQGMPQEGGQAVDPATYAMFKQCMAQYMAESGGGGAAPMAGPANAAPPAPVPYQKDSPVVDRTVEDLKARLATAERAAVAEQSRRLLDAVKGHYKFDYAREERVLCGLADDAARAEHVKYMADHYERLPTGGLLPVAEGQPVVKGDGPTPHTAPANHEKAIQYMRNTGTYDYVKALAEVSK